MKKIINAIKLTVGGIIWATIVGSTIMYIASTTWPVALVILITSLYLLALTEA